MNTMIDTLNITAVAQAMRDAASEAAKDYVRAWTESTGGNAYGEPAYCGFAWVTVYPKFQHKGNTRLGKAERAEFNTVMTQLGARLDWTGKAYQIYNPSGWPGQSMDVKEAGAHAAASVLKSYGFTAYMGSRAD
jgi:uncharacterized protein (DUF2147 family)